MKIRRKNLEKAMKHILQYVDMNLLSPYEQLDLQREWRRVYEVSRDPDLRDKFIILYQNNLFRRRYTR